MQIASEPISPMYEDWAFVTSDLHGIADEVTRRDPDCRLAWNAKTGRFALMRWATLEGVGSAWLCGRELRTLRGNTDPDRRVIHEMQESDSFRRQRPREFYRAMRDLLQIDEERKRKARMEEWEGHAEPIGHAIRKEAGVKLKAFVPDNAAAERVSAGE